MITINIYWLLLIIPLSLVAGIFIGFYLVKKHIEKRILQQLGFKNMEELLTSLKKAQELQKKLDQGNMDSMFNILNQDPQLKKQMEELRKKMGGKL